MFERGRRRGFSFGSILHCTLLVTVAASIGGWGCAIEGGRPNIVLIVVDTLRADALSIYGSTTPTPHMDSIAAEGLRFTRAVAQAPWTLPSMASLLTSRYPIEHGQGAQAGRPQVLPTTFAQRLQAAGYRTAAFLELTSPLLQQGFGTFEVAVGDTERRFRDAGNRGPSPTVSKAVEWLRTNSSRPFLLMIHTYEAHDYFLGKPRHLEHALARHPAYAGPFKRWRPRPPSEAVGSGIIDELLDATEEDIAFVRSLYEGGVKVVDEEVGRIDAALTELGLKESTLVVLTSDHGEGFAPKLRRVSHGGRLHDDLLHIPLILRWPGKILPGIEATRVESVDIAPTLLRIGDLTTQTEIAQAGGAGLRGEPLLAPRFGVARLFLRRHYVSAHNPDHTAFAEESAFQILPSGRRERSAIRQVALYSGDLKLIRAGGRDELFDLSSDPDETANLLAIQPARAAALRRRLELFVRDLGEGAEGTSEDLQEALRALGYVR